MRTLEFLNDNPMLGSTWNKLTLLEDLLASLLDMGAETLPSVNAFAIFQVSSHVPGGTRFLPLTVASDQCVLDSYINTRRLDRPQLKVNQY